MQEAAVFVYQSYIRGKAQATLAEAATFFKKAAGALFTAWKNTGPNRARCFSQLSLHSEGKRRFRSCSHGSRPAPSACPGRVSNGAFSSRASGGMTPTGVRSLSRKTSNWTLRSNPTSRRFFARPRKPAEMNFFDLRYYVQTLRRQGYPAPDLQTELHLKIAFPLAPALMTLLVCSFALHPRAGKMFMQFSGGHCDGRGLLRRHRYVSQIRPSRPNDSVGGGLAAQPSFSIPGRIFFPPSGQSLVPFDLTSRCLAVVPSKTQKEKNDPLPLHGRHLPRPHGRRIYAQSS